MDSWYDSEIDAGIDHLEEAILLPAQTWIV